LAGFRLLYGRPFTPQEYALGDRLGQEYGLAQAVRVGPIQVFGTGATINAATDNAVTRAAKLFGLSEAEVRNRCTISGGVKIAPARRGATQPADAVPPAGYGGAGGSRPAAIWAGVTQGPPRLVPTNAPGYPERERS